MGRIQNQNVHTCIDQCTCTIQDIVGDTDGGGAKQTTLLITGRVGILDCLFNILNGDQTGKMTVLIHQRQFFHTVLLQNGFCLFQSGADRGGDQPLLRSHHFGDLNVEIGHKPHIAVGDDTHQFAVLADGNTGDLEFTHQRIGFINKVIGRKEEGLIDNAVLTALYPLNFFRLLLDGHILMNDTDAAFPRHGDRHLAFGNSIHRGTHQRNIQLDLIGEAGIELDCIGQDLALGGHQQHIVEGQGFFQHFACVIHSTSFSFYLDFL